MSVLVDTSVWSLALRRKEESIHPAVLEFKTLIQSPHRIYFAGIIYQEIRQGIKDKNLRIKIREYLSKFSYLDSSLPVYELAADVTDNCSQNGVQVSLADALITAHALYYNKRLLTTDKDFTFIAKWTPLQLYPWNNN